MTLKTAIKTLTMLIWATAAQAQSDPATTAKRAIQMLGNAAKQLDEVQKSGDRIAALTQTIRAYEEGLAAMREGLRRVAIRERAITLVFEAKEDQLSRLLGVLQTIGRSPAPLLMIHPSGPIGTARSGMILSDVTPALQHEALTLKAQLQELTELRALQETAKSDLTNALANMQTARSSLAQAIANRTDLPDRVTTDAQQMTALINSADTLQSFANGLAKLGAGIENPADFATAKGTLPLPTRATLLQGFNEPDADGQTRPGLMLGVESQSLLANPWPATVRYAGPLLDQGDVIILEPGKGYLLILSGLGQTFVTQGQVLASGDPLGLMGGNSTTSDGFLIDALKGAGGNRQESLYIELRQGNAPTNPADWFVVKRE